MILNADKLRRLSPEEAKDILAKRKTRPIYIVLENVLDTYNIGGFFRLADAVGAKGLYLSGDCALPPDPKIKKASIGTYQIVPWHYRRQATEIIKDLKENEGCRVIAVEQDKRSRDFREIDYSGPIAFVFGNESFGLSKEALKLVDEIAEIPMHGFNKSLNVMVAAGLVVYQALD